MFNLNNLVDKIRPPKIQIETTSDWHKTAEDNFEFTTGGMPAGMEEMAISRYQTKVQKFGTMPDNYDDNEPMPPSCGRMENNLVDFTNMERYDSLGTSVGEKTVRQIIRKRGALPKSRKGTLPKTQEPEKPKTDVIYDELSRSYYVEAIDRDKALCIMGEPGYYINRSSILVKIFEKMGYKINKNILNASNVFTIEKDGKTVLVDPRNNLYADIDDVKNTTYLMDKVWQDMECEKLAIVACLPRSGRKDQIDLYCKANNIIFLDEIKMLNLVATYLTDELKQMFG